MIRGMYPIGAVLRARLFPLWQSEMDALYHRLRTYGRHVLPALPRHIADGRGGASLPAGTGMVGEYTLIASFLGIGLHGWQTLAAWTTSWLAFLVPLPGGLGALEASQVFTLGLFEISAGLGDWRDTFDLVRAIC